MNMIHRYLSLFICILIHHTGFAAQLPALDDPRIQPAIIAKINEHKPEWHQFKHALHHVMVDPALKRMRQTLGHKKIPGLKELYYAAYKIHGPGDAFYKAQHIVAYYTVVLAQEPTVYIWESVLAGRTPIHPSAPRLQACL